MEDIKEIHEQQEKGKLSIHTENIFPIIKKFLYSDTEIFLRELVSNAVDATQKLHNLAAMGKVNGEVKDTKVTVSLDKEAKTITISDQGIGMTAEEIKKYINQIAFSGATEFMEKYKDAEDAKNQLIGHFGLGFYSAFMVAREVEIHSLSYQDGAEPARWVCTGNTDFEITSVDKAERGTDIILHIAEDSEEYLESFKLNEILTKYAKFLPVAIEFEEKQVNNPSPLWTKQPSDLKDEDYLAFYKELYPMSEEPLFWIHLNVDYPFNLTGVLYFPKIKNEIVQNRNKIQLYSRQVFITDEVKDIVPEFLTLLHGVIDSPDIPLNVSRSFLQADSNVKKINSYITRKVADKLAELFKNDREGFEAKWDNVGLFVKYGMLTDEKFFDKAKKFALLKNIDGKCFTFDEYDAHLGDNQTDKDQKKVYLYTTDESKQDAYIQSAKKRGYDVLTFDTVIDTHFTSHLESKLENVTLKRVDADAIDKLVDKDEAVESILSEDEQNKLKELFKKATANDKLEVEIKTLPEDEFPVLIVVPEFMRRMQEMQMANGMSMPGMDPSMFRNVMVNGNHALIKGLLESGDEKVARHLYDIALLSQNSLEGKELTEFMQRSLSFIK